MLFKCIEKDDCNKTKIETTCLTATSVSSRSCSKYSISCKQFNSIIFFEKSVILLQNGQKNPHVDRPAALMTNWYNSIAETVTIKR